jgi:NTE family protein
MAMERSTCLVLSGGIALGAYQGGAYAALDQWPELQPRHIAGSSAGAVNGAIIAGTPPRGRVEALAAFWNGNASDLWWPGARWVADAPAPVRRAYRWILALQTRMLGCPGVMRPHTFELLFGNPLGLYDLSPLRARLVQLVDFERLNRGEVRFSVTTTDLVTGEAVVFDTARGDEIGPDHLIASCGFVPEFPPIEIGGRLLGDGGLAANLPIEAALGGESHVDGELLCFAVDLFAPEGRRPATLTQAASRSLDLFFANQTDRGLRALARSGHPASVDRARRPAHIVPVRYRVRADEPGPHRLFDFSSAALRERWATGYSDMTAAIARTLEAGL